MDELRAAHYVDRTEPAFVFEDRQVTCAELAAEAANAQPSETPYALIAQPTEENLRSVAARILAGVPIFPSHPKWSESQRNAAITRLVSREPRSESASEPAYREPILAYLATSGSTGEPKLVRLSRRAFIESARRSALNVPLGSGDRWLLAMPFAHTGGLSIITRCLLAKATVVVHPGFDPERVLRSVSAERVTHLSVVPTTLRTLLKADRENVLARLKAVLVGGAGCPADLIEEAWRRGLQALTTYGLTETCSQVVTQSLDSRPARTATDSGVPMSGVRITLLDSSGSECPAGESGRIAIETPTLMSGYLGSPWLPAETRLITEDLGRLDEAGRLFVLGRADDTIVTGGENVHPLEVERQLLGLGGVSEALVAGVSDPTWGSVVAAMVVLDQGTTLAEIEGRSRAAMAPHHRPRIWLKESEIPKNAIGKPDRKAARELLTQSKQRTT